MGEQDVKLTISKEIVNPIVEAKIKSAVMEALGGKDRLIESLIDKIIMQKVDHKGKISSYPSDNKYTWLDVVVTKQIKVAIEEELKRQIKDMSGEIRKFIIKRLQTKKGADMTAKALLDSLDKTLESSWRSSINVEIISPAAK